MKKYISLLIAIMMFFSLLPPLIPVQAKPKEKDRDIIPSIQKEMEVIDERTANSQTFIQEDGLYRMEISPEPIHVQDKKTKEWEPIDNKLSKKDNGRFHNKKNEFDASFAPKAENGDSLVSIEQQGKSLDIVNVDQNGQSTASVMATVEDNQVTYKEVYSNTDLTYTVGNSSIKEDIILKQKPSNADPLEYSFQFKIKGLTLEKTEDGYLYLLDSTSKERLFAIEKPFMMDSATPEGFTSRMEHPMPEGSLSDQVEMEAIQKGNKLHITLKPNMEWLNSSERVYPVIIDPTVKVYQPKNDLNDTTIRSAFPNQTGGADLEMGAGFHSTSNNLVRSLLQFDMGTLPRGAKIMNAQLNLRLSSVWNDTASSIGLYEMNSAWEENRATWQRRTQSALWTNKGGDFNSTLLSSQTIGALDTTAAEPQLFKWTIKPEIIQKWMNDPSKNLGLILKATNENAATYKKFYSGDYSGKLQYSPKLTITYYPVSRLGLESYWSYSEHALSDGQGHVNLGTGNLVLDFTDFSVTGRGNSGFSFARTYNSKAVEDSPVGYGWSFTGSETMAEFPNGDVLYTDADGTAHTFAYDTSTKTFKAPAGLYLKLVKANTDAFVLTDFNGNRVVFRDLIKNPEQQGRIYPIDYEEDRNKNKITYQREADGTLTGITDATDRKLTLTYQNGRIQSGTFEGVKKFAYTYDTAGRLKTSTIYKDATTGSTTTYNYNTDGQLINIVDANNQTTHYLYNTGFLEQVKQPMISDVDSNITYKYDIYNLTASEFDAYGKETKYKLNDNYIITSITDPMGFVSSFTYDENYNLLTEKDPKGNITVNTYDAKGNVETTTDPLDNKVSYTYNNFSQPLTVTDADGTMTYEYNAYGDVIKEINPLNEVTIFDYYEPYGNLKSMTPPGGIPETYEYDAMQNYPKKFTDALGRKTSIVNDKYGNAKEVTDPKGNKVSFDYDEQEQLKSAVDEKGQETSYEYDNNGNLTTIKNPRGYTTTLRYNSQNQFISRKEPLGQTTTYGYDAIGNMTTEKKPDGNTVIKTDYDANSRPTDIFINGYLKWHYDYDKNGNTTAVQNGENNDTSTFTYDKADKLKTASNGKQVVEYGYSPTETLTDIKGTSNGSSFAQKFAFDDADQLKNWYRNGGIQGAYEYYPTGEPQQRRYVNGIHTNYTYDDAQQMKTLKVTKGTTVLLDESLGYDLNGNVNSVTSSTGNKAFAYDKTNQLESQTISSAQLTESYTYDAVGNRKTKTTVKDGKTTDTTYEYDANNRLTSVNGQTYSYDANGNRTKDNKYTYVYNKFDQVTSIKTNAGTTVATFTYDDQGRRTSKTVDGKTTYYHYDQGINVLFETDSNGTITSEYIYDPDGMPLVMTKGGQNYYYTYNSLKEITGLTNTSGTVVASYSYDAWGNILSESGAMAKENPIRYKGYRYDDETDLYYLIARYYQPTEGVFLTVDPEGGDTDDPKTQNGYAYASSNPVMMTDPDGNYAWLVINAGFAAYSGYKAYKSGKGWKGVAGAAAMGAIGGGKFKVAKAGIKITKKKPFQVHHFATNKSKRYTKKFQKIANKYDLDLDAGWNKKRMRHQGRHPNAYHDYMLRNMKKLDKYAKGNKQDFQRGYRSLRKHVQKNPEMLYSNYWKKRR
ncbi:DNRLRE domain-containing protein [Bacillus sp. FJAT-52991]|uniref:DNRLRE domain-containing protein n=1 Tax=Bacillus kandeliae TaxID=3129297 RepID=A0ABZ2NAI1_9BACI